MNKIKIFVHTNNSQKFEIAEVNNDHKVGHLVKDFTPELSKQKDFLEDVEVYLEDHVVDFDKGFTIEEACIKHGDHVFVGRCKKITVNINYAGNTYSVPVSPATSMKKLKKLALRHFGIDDVSGAELLLWFNKNPMDARQMVGSLTDYPACVVDLVLATKNDINGDPSSDLFQEHLCSAEYQSGEIEGRWGIITNENGPSWPVFFFWVTSTIGEKFNFKFDFTSYTSWAPTAMIWDIESNTPLPLEKRPRQTKRQQQIFKNWGKLCLYLPCDRMAFEGHANWAQLHPSLIWDKQNDTFLKYLNELYQILNP